MDKVVVYWDNSNIFISAQEAATELEGDAVRYRVRLHFRHLMELACAGRDIERAIAVGSIPPELRHVWNRLENEGFTVQLLERGAIQGREQGVDQALQTVMLRDTVDYNGDPGIAVLLTGDGSGFADGVGFHADLERMRRRMREWAEEQGTFIALDDFYESVTFLEPPAPGQPMANPRFATPPDLARRAMG